MQKLIKNDKVIVLTGKYKNKTGTILKIFPNLNKALVKGINLVKRHKKNEDPNKRIIEKELPIHISNLALLDKKNEEKKIKVSFITKDNIKIRINKQTKEII